MFSKIGPKGDISPIIDQIFPIVDTLFTSTLFTKILSLPNLTLCRPPPITISLSQAYTPQHLVPKVIMAQKLLNYNVGSLKINIAKKGALHICQPQRILLQISTYF